ncbi:MAG: nucleoside triphosphate pyrophosphohydrolase [Pyrinomonadaceae bacterium]|nr:nucleoside triphosphate pyrophosphohydrolase [Pyrinomonadaceae bacterium]
MSEKFTEFVNVMRRLRAPDGCPWDREQTHKSLAPHLIEECYEALDAIYEIDGAQHLKEELGDVLLQIVFHAQIAEDNGDFTVDDVVEGINQKMVLRHPHVFGDLKLEKSDDVLRNWDELKKAERAASGKTEKPKDSILEDVTVHFPALLEAQKITKKAAKVGFDWESATQIFDKLSEESAELSLAIVNLELAKSRAISENSSDVDDEQNARRQDLTVEFQKQIAEEVGDLLFVVVTLARHLKVDAETALKQSNQKFRRRFAFIEKSLREDGKAFSDSSLKEMDALWNEAKHSEKN